MTGPSTVPTLPPDSHVNRLWISLVTFSLALGIASVALADAESRRGYGYTRSSYLFWLGMFLVFVPTALRLLMKDVDRRERLTLVVLLGTSLYLVKYLGSPAAFTFSDEYIHIRNTQEILRTHHLFWFNPLLPTAAYYPGLAAVTAGLVKLTGLSIFACGLLVIGVARILFVACFYLIAERVTRSDRAAAGASLIYAANPMFLFWSAAFSYENLAMPLAAFVIWWLGRTRQLKSHAPMGVAVVAILAVTVTHPVVAFALSALLGTWWLIERFTERPSDAQRAIGLMALLSTTTTLVWFFFVARPAASYLFSDNILPALRQTVSLILGHISPRHLYASGGFVTPEWETIAGFVAVGVLLLALLPGLHLAWRHRYRAPMVVAIGVAILFPLSLVLRLVPEGVGISGRSSEYIFAGLGCVLGLLVTDETWRRHRQHPRRSKRAGIAGWKKSALVTVLVTLVFIGEITVGTPFYELLSEVAHPHGYPWLVQPDAISASKWAREHLGINQRFASDRLDSFALATYGEQNTVAEDKVWPIFFATEMNGTVVRSIKSARIHFLFVDWQMTKGVPPTPGFYFSHLEPGAGEYRNAFPPAALKKFVSSTCIDLAYHHDEIQIFDVSRIENGSCVPVMSSYVENKGTHQ
jgi:hypothetical protein